MNNSIKKKLDRLKKHAKRDLIRYKVNEICHELIKDPSKFGHEYREILRKECYAYLGIDSM